MKSGRNGLDVRQVARMVCGPGPVLGSLTDPEAAIIDNALVAYLPAASPATGAGLQWPVLNPVDWVGGGIGFLVRGLLRDLVDDFLKNLAEPVLRYVLHTPDLLAEPTLRRLWATSLGALFVLAALLVGIAGTAMITGSSTRLGMAAREAVGVRLAGTLLTAAVSLPVVALEVQLANRLVDGLAAAGAGGAADPITSALVRNVQGDLGSSLALLVTTLVAVVFLVVLTLLGLARWATMWLLIVLAPLAAGLSLLPSGGAAMRAWWRLQVTAVFLPVAHAVLVATWVAMFSSNKTGLVGALGGVATLALMAKLPGWAAGAAMGLDTGDVAHQVRRTRGYARTAVRTVAAARAGSASATAGLGVGGVPRVGQRGTNPGTSPGGAPGRAAPPG